MLVPKESWKKGKNKSGLKPPSRGSKDKGKKASKNPTKEQRGYVFTLRERRRTMRTSKV